MWLLQLIAPVARGWVTLSANFRRKGRHPPTAVGVKNQNDCPFVWYQNIHSTLFDFVTKQTCVRQTARQTDRIMTPKTALAQPRAASSDKNHAAVQWPKSTLKRLNAFNIHDSVQTVQIKDLYLISGLISTPHKRGKESRLRDTKHQCIRSAARLRAAVTTLFVCTDST